MRGNILVIDDEKYIFEELQEGLPAHNLFYSGTLSGVKDTFTRKQIDLAIVDLQLKINIKDRFSGLDYIKTIRSRYPEINILVISQHRDIEHIQTAVQNGANHYLWKSTLDIDTTEFRELINKLIKDKKTRDKKREQLRTEIWGTSEETLQLKKQIELFARQQQPFFLIGEAGVGKENIAYYLQFHSSYSQTRDLTKINLAHHEQLELLRVLKNKTRKQASNFLKQAHGHILYVKRIDRTDISIQEGFYRIWQSRRFLDSREAVKPHFIFALEEDPRPLITAGKFSSDLYEAFPKVYVKPLRERISDLYDIVPRWLKMNGYPKEIIPEEIWEWLVRYEYPGNVSELFGILEYMMNQHQQKHGRQFLSKKLEPDALPPMLTESRDVLEDLFLEVARLELSYIERALHRYAIYRDQKSRAARALGITSADNMNKTYIQKYNRLYPALIRQFPMIVKSYKLNEKD